MARHRQKQKKRSSAVITVAALVLALAGLGLLARPYYVRYQQEKIGRQLADAIEDGRFEIEVDPDAFAVEGERTESWIRQDQQHVSPPPEPQESPEPEQSAPPAGTAAPKRVTVQGVGTMSISKIDLKMPIADGATTVTLRYALGLMKGSARIGQRGRSVIFGHRMRTYGRHFNRLEEVGVGDVISLADTQGVQYEYTVFKTDTILPEQLYETLKSGSRGQELLLITCTPMGVSTHRYLVFARMQ